MDGDGYLCTREIPCLVKIRIFRTFQRYPPDPTFEWVLGVAADLGQGTVKLTLLRYNQPRYRYVPYLACR